MVEEVLSLESRSDGEGSKWHFCIAANVPGEEDSDFTFEAILRLSGNEGETGKGYNWQAKNVYYDKSIEMEPKPKPKEECVPFAEARTSWAKVNAFTQNLERAPIGGQEAALEHFPKSFDARKEFPACKATVENIQDQALLHAPHAGLGLVNTPSVQTA